MGDEGEKGLVCQTKPRWHQFISASSVTYVTRILDAMARILYWAGIHGITAWILYVRGYIVI